MILERVQFKITRQIQLQTVLASHDKETVRNGQTSYLRWKTSVKLLIDQMMRPRGFRTRNDDVEWKSVDIRMTVCEIFLNGWRSSLIIQRTQYFLLERARCILLSFFVLGHEGDPHQFLGASSSLRSWAGHVSYKFFEGNLGNDKRWDIVRIVKMFFFGQSWFLTTHLLVRVSVVYAN